MHHWGLQFDNKDNGAAAEHSSTAGPSRGTEEISIGHFGWSDAAIVARYWLQAKMRHSREQKGPLMSESDQYPWWGVRAFRETVNCLKGAIFFWPTRFALLSQEGKSAECSVVERGCPGTLAFVVHGTPDVQLSAVERPL